MTDQPDEEKTVIVVSLKRSYWHDKNGTYQRTTLRYLKRQTKGFNVFHDDCDMVGAGDVVNKIINLDICPDGKYYLVTCNAHKDWETGHIEDWDYELTPYEL